MVFMERQKWLQKWKDRRAKMLREHLKGASWNDLARKYGKSVTSIGKLIKRAKTEVE